MIFKKRSIGSSHRPTDHKTNREHTGRVFNCTTTEWEKKCCHSLAMKSEKRDHKADFYKIQKRPELPTPEVTSGCSISAFMKIEVLAGSVLLGGSLYLTKQLWNIQWLYYPILVVMALVGGGCLSYVVHQIKRILRKNTAILSPCSSVYTTTPMLLAVLLIITYTVTFTFMSIQRYRTYSVSMYDFGNMDQAIWNTSRGNLLEVTEINPPYNNSSRLNNHIEIIYVVFALLYRLYAHPYILFVAQTLFVAFGIWAIFQITIHVLQSRWMGLAVASLASLYPSLQFANLFDFHGDVLAIPFLLWSYVAYVRKRWGWYWVCVVSALICKEYVALALVGYGITQMVTPDRSFCGIGMHLHKHGVRYNRKINGMLTTVIGCIYFLIVMYGIFPLRNSGTQPLVAAIYPGIGDDGLTGLVMYAFREPATILKRLIAIQNGESFIYLFFPLLFVPFVAPQFLFGAIPIFLKDSLVGMDIGNHRLAIAFPFIFIAFIHGIEKMKRWGDGYVKIGCLYYIVSATLIAAYAYGPSPIGHRFWRENDKYVRTDRDSICDAMLNKIPPGKSISVSRYLAPHVTHRRFCYLFPRPMLPGKRTLNDVGFVCIDTSDRTSLAWGHSSFHDETIPEIFSLGYCLLAENDGIYLFSKKE